MNRFVLGGIFFILYYVLNVFTDFFANSNLQQVYYESGFWQFLKESIIETLDRTALAYCIFGF